ncbi:penicillin-binding protein 1A [Flectobacillus roseus]|uniref:Transglycosylase domain-containing protein n=1 Tax=Flectobacillus roseus TaxID=502259 RepID=A0ABT6Y7U5_9BACT|nr:transglycosylase domain-containing protein [Flectobacillus roseus]MDI9859606.1 transglycosylase domain-containing protein [Flectobacillus roseus]
MINKIGQFLKNLGVKLFRLIWFLPNLLLEKVLGKQKLAAFYQQFNSAQEQYEEKKNQLLDSLGVDKDAQYYLVVRKLWKAFAWTVFAGVFFIFTIENNFLWLTGEMPSVGELQNPKLSQSSEIYSADGVLLGKFFQENRTPIKNYKELSPYLVKALIATEDARFYEHSGIDYRAMFGVAVGILKGGERGGGSTITQQLAKNLFKTRKKEGIAKKGLLGVIPGVKTLIIKTKEWLTAIKLERYYTKDEIILWYLNTVDFGSNSYGIKVAAKRYFNTSPDSLNVQEAAVLVGMQKATTTYNPIKYRNKPLDENKSWKRRNVVLSQMVKYGFLKQAQYDSLSTLPIVLKEHEESPYDGTGNYFKVAVAKYLNEWAAKNEIELDLYRDGLKIITTIDSRLQTYAEDAVSEGMRNIQKTFDGHWSGKNPWVDEKGTEIPGFIDTVAKRTEYYKSLVKRFPTNQDSVWYYMKKVKRKMWVYSRNTGGEEQLEMTPYDSIQYYKKFLQAGMMTMDPFTGHIKAWVGGLDFKYFKYDHVKQGKRQPGSTFKPFVYTAAIDGPKDLSPCYTMKDEPFEIEVEEKGEMKLWRPNNADGHFSYQTMPIKRALAKSINSITARLTDEVGADTVMYYAKQMGIESPLRPVASIGLGSFDVSLYEMVGAYSAFVNEGIHAEPLLVSEIQDQNGNVIQQFDPQIKRVIKKESAQLLLNMLQGTIYEGGTGSSLLWGDGATLLPEKNRYAPAFAGKTGTTSNHSDGWFMGMTTNLVTGVWVGGDDRSIHFRTGAYGEGSKTAMPLYRRFMLKVKGDPDLKQYHPVPFEKLDQKKFTKQFNCTGNWWGESRSSNDSTTVSTDSLGGGSGGGVEVKPDSTN